MTDLFEQSSQKLDAAITEIQNAIATGMANKQRLFETMSQLYGEGSANGAWSQRDAFDLLEAALTRHMAGLLSKPQMLTQISEISALIEALPTHTVRSENQLRYQQFSTPADLAALSVILAQPLATDIVLEPSAGHGALVATLPDVRDRQDPGADQTCSFGAGDSCRRRVYGSNHQTRDSPTRLFIPTATASSVISDLLQV